MKSKSRPRGWGKVVKRPNGGWSIRYWRNGKGVQESVARAFPGLPPDQITEDHAKQLLDRRIAEKLTGRGVEQFQTSKLTVHQLLDAYGEDLRGRQVKSVVAMLGEITQLKGLMTDDAVVCLTAQRLQAFQQEMLKGEYRVGAERRRYKPATVRGRLAVLRAAWRYGEVALGLAPAPKWPVLKLKNARQRIVTEAEFEQVHRRLRLDDPLPDVVEFAWLTGWRISEVLGLTWQQVSLEEGVIRLVTSKSGRPRTRPIGTGELRDLLRRRVAARHLGRPNVFHKRGAPIAYGWLNKRWRAAVTLAELGDVRVHDLRRSAYAALLAAGVSTVIAMALLGWESVSTAKRYGIPELPLLEDAVAKDEAHRAARHLSNTRAARGGREGDSPS